MYSWSDDNYTMLEEATGHNQTHLEIYVWSRLHGARAKLLTRGPLWIVGGRLIVLMGFPFARALSSC